MQKNNHFSLKDAKSIIHSFNRLTLEHPQVCWMSSDTNKPKSFLELGYLKDQDKDYKE